MFTPCTEHLPRLLGVCDSTPLRRELSDLLYDVMVETRWHLRLAGLIEYAQWCRPDLVLLALRDTEENLRAYQSLEAAFGTSSALRISLLGVPQDGVPFPSPQRQALDRFVTPPATLHELAWLVRQANDSRRKPPARGIHIEDSPKPRPGFDAR